VCRENDITQLGCWSHVRRKFHEVLKAAGINPRQPPKGQPPPKARRALKALGFIGHLFAIEQRIRGRPPDERHRVRTEESLPVLEKLRAWLDATLPEAPPASALGRALGYLDAQWPKLVRYCEDGRLEMHNNRAENAIRPFVLGRKNWLFADSLAGAKAEVVQYLSDTPP
jgi:transposase